MSFAPFAYWRSHLHIEPKHGFGFKGGETGVMSNIIG